MELSKKLIKDIIRMYREREFLWRVSSEDYRKKDVRLKGYQEIVNYLKSQGVTDVTDSLVRDKIQNMRRSVRKERSKIESCTGYITTLWYYDLLKYVLDQDKATPTSKMKTKNIKLEKEDSDTDHSSNDPLYDGPLCIDDRSQPDDLNTTETHNKVEETQRAEVTYLRNPDEYEALGIGIAAKVRRMDSTQRIYAELLIQKVLAKGLLGKLNDATDLSDMINK